MEDEEMFDVKLIFNEEEVEIQLNSQYTNDNLTNIMEILIMKIIMKIKIISKN